MGAYDDLIGISRLSTIGEKINSKNIGINREDG